MVLAFNPSIPPPPSLSFQAAPVRGSPSAKLDVVSQRMAEHHETAWVGVRAATGIDSSSLTALLTPSHRSKS